MTEKDAIFATLKVAYLITAVSATELASHRDRFAGCRDDARSPLLR